MFWNRPALLLLASACLVLGCGRSTVAPLPIESLDRLTLYSIDGRDSLTPEEKAKAAETFHGYPVLGRVEVAEPEQRRELMAALKEGLARSDGTVARCFWPRHGVRAVDGGKTVEYVICFQCLQLVEFLGDRSQTRPTTRDPQPVFDRPLRDKGIPMAPTGE